MKTELKIWQRIDVWRLDTTVGYEANIARPGICRLVIQDFNCNLIKLYHPNIVDNSILINPKSDEVVKVSTLIIKSIK